MCRRFELGDVATDVIDHFLLGQLRAGLRDNERNHILAIDIVRCADNGGFSDPGVQVQDRFQLGG